MKLRATIMSFFRGPKIDSATVQQTIVDATRQELQSLKWRRGSKSDRLIDETGKVIAAINHVAEDDHVARFREYELGNYISAAQAEAAIMDRVKLLVKRRVELDAYGPVEY
jgi:C4-dicarboxylate-specific signal transduction histidine kinase